MRENSEVVIIYPDMSINIYIYIILSYIIITIYHMGMNQDLIPMGDHRFFWRPAINMGGGQGTGSGINIPQKLGDFFSKDFPGHF